MGRRAEPRRGEAESVGVGEEDRSRDGAGAGQEVGQGPGREQEGEGSAGQEGEAAVADGLRLLLVPDAPSQVGQLRISAQLLQRHAAQRVAVGPA